MIRLAPVDLAIVALYFAAVLVIGFRAGRTTRGGGTTEYLLAGRSLTLPVFVMTLVSTWYGGILGVGEFSYLYGISNWLVQGVPYYVFSALFAWLLAKKIRATNLASIPDQLHAAFGRPTAILGAGLTFLLMTPAPYVLMLGLLLHLATGWDPTVCLVAGTVATTVYLYAGGFRSDVQTDILEFLLMFLGFAVILPFAYGTYGGVDFLRSHLPPLHLTWDGGNSWQFIVVWFLIALWTLVDPAFHQRCYAAASGEVARRGILWSILFWFLFDAMTATAGLYARAALPSLSQPVMAYPLLAEAVLPPVAKGFFYVGMLATIMSTLNTLAFVSASTLGRDIVWRMRGGPPGRDEMRTTRWGLIVTGVLAVALALFLPSVIRLWYAIGTVIIPGLLLPVITSYYPALAVPPRWTFAAMLCGWLMSLGWLAAGWSHGLGSTEHYPLGVEPMFAGLAVAGIVWGSGRWR